jgi:hypothetical protein
VFRGYFSATEDELKEGGSKMFSLGEIITHPPQGIEMNDILTQLNQMDEDKKKVFIQLISSMKGG